MTSTTVIPRPDGNPREPAADETDYTSMMIAAAFARAIGRPYSVPRIDPRTGDRLD